MSHETRVTISQIIHELVRIAFRAEKGDEKAANQLKVLHKVAHPFSYELPATVIKKLADSYHISPHLARGWSVRDLMVKLSFVVEPTRLDRSVLDGPVKLTTRELHTVNRKLHAKAKKHIHTNTTLQSLAISLYLEELDKEGITLNPNQIKADLRKLKEWETVNLKEDSPHYILLWNRPGEYPPASLPPIPIYSNGWKRKWRRGSKIANS
jgi:hypothetical protein